MQRRLRISLLFTVTIFMLQGDDALTPGVIYLGHIPHGFYEDEIRGFFSQFGTINKVRLSRSKKVCPFSKRHDRFILWSKYKE